MFPTRLFPSRLFPDRLFAPVGADAAAVARTFTFPDEDDIETMFEDTGGVLGVFGGFETYGHLEDPTGDIFFAPTLTDGDRVFACRAGVFVGIQVGDELTIDGEEWEIRDRARPTDGAIEYFLVMEA